MNATDISSNPGNGAAARTTVRLLPVTAGCLGAMVLMQLGALAAGGVVVPVVLAVASAAVGAGMLWWLHGNVIRPLERIANHVHELAQPRADLSRSVPDLAGTPWVSFAQDVAALQAGVRVMVTDTRQMSVSIAIGACRMARLMSGTSASAEAQGALTDVIFDSSRQVRTAMATVNQHAVSIAGSTNTNLGAAQSSYRELLGVVET